MSELNRVDTALLEVIAGMNDGKTEGAFNIRKDSGCAGRGNTENVTITTKTDKPGIDIRFVPGCKDTCHIPVIITERLLTHGSQRAESDMTIELNGENSRGRVISRSVAKNDSVQVFRPCVVGNAKCFGHVQCDSIIMDEAKIRSVPEIAANDLDAQLIHEAAIGRIAGDQLLKLETLGLTEEEAEDRILKGFLA